jgi:hypothetical protein
MARAEASEWVGRRPCEINIKHLFGRITHNFGSFLELWDEQRRNNKLTRRSVVPWYEYSFSVITAQS